MNDDDFYNSPEWKLICACKETSERQRHLGRCYTRKLRNQAIKDWLAWNGRNIALIILACVMWGFFLGVGLLNGGG